jgi:hypothetical protein
MNMANVPMAMKTIVSDCCRTIDTPLHRSDVQQQT